MSPQQPSTLLAIERLRRSLDMIAAAVAGARLTDLLSVESEFASALAATNRIVDVPETERLAVMTELREAQRSLARCQRLGVAICDVRDAILTAQGRHDQYDRAGLAASAAPYRSNMDVRA